MMDPLRFSSSLVYRHEYLMDLFASKAFPIWILEDLVYRAQENHMVKQDSA